MPAAFSQERDVGFKALCGLSIQTRWLANNLKKDPQLYFCFTKKVPEIMLYQDNYWKREKEGNLALSSLNLNSQFNI